VTVTFVPADAAALLIVSVPCSLNGSPIGAGSGCGGVVGPNRVIADDVSGIASAPGLDGQRQQPGDHALASLR
jgi:hypothetical protein